MSRSVVIPPEGPIVPSDEDPSALARRVLETDSLDVVTARALGRERIHVLWIDDWGKVNELPLNRRAWALYGGSPIYGTAVLAADDDLPVAETAMEMLGRPDFPGPDLLATMDAWLRANP
jgi:hypothetical protein